MQHHPGGSGLPPPTFHSYPIRTHRPRTVSWCARPSAHRLEQERVVHEENIRFLTMKATQAAQVRRARMYMRRGPQQRRPCPSRRSAPLSLIATEDSYNGEEEPGTARHGG